MKVRMKILGTGMEIFPEPEYLKEFDINFKDGAGAASTTVDPKEAMVFESLAAAVALWKSVSPLKPVRKDGRPNRPLTTFSVTFENVDEEEKP